MDKTKFKGNYFEIGIQLGEIYRQKGLNFDNVKINSKFLKNQLRVYGKYYPDFLEELKGVAKGGNFDLQKILSLHLTGEIDFYINKIGLSQACTIFGAKTKNGTFIGRNYDWLPITEKIFEVYQKDNPRCFNFIGVSDMGIGSEDDVKNKFLFYDTIDVINEEGLFVGITFGYYDFWQYGLSWREISRYIIENCKTVKEALKVFDIFPLSCPKNFFITDKQGNMAVVEHVVKKFKVIYPEKNVLIKSNHYVDHELAKEDTVLERNPTHNTFIRYYETLQNINAIKDNFEFNDIIKILGNIKTYTCQNQDNIKTIWTLALNMQKGIYSLYWDLFKDRKEKILKIK